MKEPVNWGVVYHKSGHTLCRSIKNPEICAIARSLLWSLVQNPAGLVSYQPHGARYNSNTFCFLSNEIFCWDFYLLDDVWLSKCWDWWDTSLELVSISTRPSQQQFIFIDRRNKNTYQHSFLSCLCLSIKGFSKGTELINWKYH